MAGDADFKPVAALVAEFQEVVGADVGDDVAEGAIEGDHFTGEAFVVDDGWFQIQADQFLDGRADLGPIIAAGEVGAYGRENIAAVEGGGDFGADHPVGVRNLADGFDAVAVFDHGHQAVVGENEELSALRFHNQWLARAADRGINDYHEDGAGGEVGSGSEEEAGAVADGKSVDLVGEIDDSKVGRDAVHDTFAEGDRVVDDAEIGHEDDGGR